MTASNQHSSHVETLRNYIKLGGYEIVTMADGNRSAVPADDKAAMAALDGLVEQLEAAQREAEAAKFPVETVFAWKDRAETAEARCREFERELDRENAAWWISHDGKRRLRLVVSRPVGEAS